MFVTLILKQFAPFMVRLFWYEFIVKKVTMQYLWNHFSVIPIGSHIAVLTRNKICEHSLYKLTRKPTQLGTHSCKLSEMEETIKLLLKEVNRRIRKPTQLGTHSCKLSEMEETIKTNIERSNSTNQKTYPTRKALMQT